MKIEWTKDSLAQFEAARSFAGKTGRSDRFTTAHNEIVPLLADPVHGAEAGELLFRTKLDGGEVRVCARHPVSVVCVMFPAKMVGWIWKYDLMMRK